MAVMHTKTRSRWRPRRDELYPVIVLLMLATTPAIFLGDGNRNLGLIALMFVSPAFALQLFSRRMLPLEIFLLFGFAISIVLLPALFHGDTRWSTIFYSLMFCGLFVSYDNMLRGGSLRIMVFIRCIKYLLFAYTGVLVIQQICVLIGLPIFNVSNYNPSEPWKLNSLSAEPSHSARIVGLLMVSYVVALRVAPRLGAPNLTQGPKDTLVYACFLWTMITMLSATSVVMLGIVGLAHFDRLKLRYILLGTIIVGATLLLIPDQLTERVFRISAATLSLDYEEVLRADHSGAMRVAPMLLLLDRVEILSFAGLFGHGVDSVSLFLSHYIWGIQEGATGGASMALWYEYGFITFAFFMAFTIKATGALRAKVNFAVWFLLVFLGGVNNQMAWLAIVCLYTLRFYERRAHLLDNRVRPSSVLAGSGGV